MKHPTHRRVAVVGSAQTVLAPGWRDRHHIDLIAEAGTAALKGTSPSIDDVDFVIDSGSDFLDGRSISDCGFLGAMGAHHKEESRVEEDGLWALGYAVDKIAAGPASVGPVIADSKPSESNLRNYWTGLLEPFVQASSVVHIEFVGRRRTPPYDYAEIILDGASTTLIHTVGALDPEQAKTAAAPGARVRAVRSDRHTGSLADIDHFEVI